MKSTSRRLIANWCIGAIVGTALIAITSPPFVRSYVPLVANPVRGVWTLSPGHTSRWRSEGYADTHVGPLGMPGKVSLEEPRANVIRVALWGDSQAEGICVSDHEKIFAQAERIGAGRIDVLPLCRSGEDAADWLTQIPRVEQELDIDVHVMLIVDLLDLFAAVNAPVPSPAETDIAHANAAIAAKLPAFVIQAARRLLTESDEETRRKLRFSVGPVAMSPPIEPDIEVTDWTASVTAVREVTQRPLIVLYAPKSPKIVAGEVILQDAGANDFLEIKRVADAVGLTVVDARSDLLRSAQEGRWPHGFQNGLIGIGHLNAIGNQIVASLLVATATESEEQGN